MLHSKYLTTDATAGLCIVSELSIGETDAATSSAVPFAVRGTFIINLFTTSIIVYLQQVDKLCNRVKENGQLLPLSPCNLLSTPETSTLL